MTHEEDEPRPVAGDAARRDETTGIDGGGRPDPGRLPHDDALVWPPQPEAPSPRRLLERVASMGERSAIGRALAEAVRALGTDATPQAILDDAICRRMYYRSYVLGDLADEDPEAALDLARDSIAFARLPPEQREAIRAARAKAARDYHLGQRPPSGAQIGYLYGDALGFRGERPADGARAAELISRLRDIRRAEQARERAEARRQRAERERAAWERYQRWREQRGGQA